MEQKVLELLKQSDSLLEGHFLLSSGKHSDRYVQCAKVCMYPERLEVICQAIKARLDEAKVKVDCVVGPAMGGIIVAYELARVLGVRAMFTERENNVMTFRRNFSVKKGEKVLIVEDVVTTGKSSLESIAVVEGQGGNVVGIASIVDRTNGKFKEQPLYPAISLQVNAYEASECPLCQEGQLPVVKPGSRKM